MQLRKRGLRPQLGDSVIIAKADDPRDGQEATVVQVKQPGAIPPISPHISLYLPISPAGHRAAAQGARRHTSHISLYLQDDRDAQPFRLRYADSELSMVFYREHHVKLSEATRRRRAEEEAERLKLQQGEDEEED